MLPHVEREGGREGERERERERENERDPPNCTAEAQYTLGMLLLEGSGVPKDGATPA